MAARKTPPKKPPARPTVVVEWIVATVGLLLVLATLGILAREIFAPNRTVVDIALSVERITPAGEQWAVQVKVDNRGGQSAAQVEVEGTSAGEDRSFTVDYLPAHGSARGALYFAARPDPGSLALAPVSWQAP